MKRPTFLAVKLTQLICVIYILVLTFSYAPFGLRDPATGNIINVGGNNSTSSDENNVNGVILVNGHYRPIVAQGTYELLCLGISRISAFSMYPVMILVYLSKCKASLNYLEKTPISMFLYKDEHKLHIYCGQFIAFDIWIHTAFHLLRWNNQGNTSLLWTTATGLTGLLTVIITPLITCLMTMETCKRYIPYEIRKGLHYLFYIFAIAMCFHVPPSPSLSSSSSDGNMLVLPLLLPNGGFLPYTLGCTIGIYTLDRLYVIFFMTERIETSKFRVLPDCGVQMTLAVSDRFRNCGEKGGFGYVCLPWVRSTSATTTTTTTSSSSSSSLSWGNKNGDNRQWHAFSLFQDPENPKMRVVLMLNVGDWTNALHDELERGDTSRPVWIQGPFSSPYKMARDFDNQILVSTGIGITAALSVIEAHKSSRTIFLIWTTRDPAMVEFFLENYHYLDHEYGFNFIYYTGTAPLNHPTLLVDEGEGGRRMLMPYSNLQITHSRPNLDAIIPDIIHASECRATGKEGQQQNKYRSNNNNSSSSSKNTNNNFHSCSKCQAIHAILERSKEFDTAETMPKSSLSSYRIDDREKLEELTVMANDYGYDFSDLSSHLRDAAIPCPFTAMKARKTTGHHSHHHHHHHHYYSHRHHRSHHQQQIFPNPDTEDESLSSSEIEDNNNNNNKNKSSLSSSNMLMTMMSDANASIAFKRIRKFADIWNPTLHASRSIKKMEHKMSVLSRWGIMYCGGSSQVKGTLKDMSKEFDIDLHYESFSW